MDAIHLKDNAPNIVVCRDLSGKDLCRQVGMDRMITAERVMPSTLVTAWQEVGI